MHVGQRYRISQTIWWSRSSVFVPAAWAAAAVGLYELFEFRPVAIPWLPISVLGIAVAFYLGFKNNASYDRLWEDRKIWGAIVNASRSWAYSIRDLVSAQHQSPRVISDETLHAIHVELVTRHVAWMDALRFQLRRVQSWEHRGPRYDALRRSAVPEHREDLSEVLGRNLDPGERDRVLAQINPAAHLLSHQSRRLKELREQGLLDGFAHIELQRLLHALTAEQGKAERIKNFPFPRQYATVNAIFAWLFAALVPFGLLKEFDGLGDGLVWLTVPFATLVSWVFLTTNQIGEWSENPFEGLANDVPISAMARGIERDIRQLVGLTELPPPRELEGMIQY